MIFKTIADFNQLLFKPLGLQVYRQQARKIYSEAIHLKQQKL